MTGPAVSHPVGKSDDVRHLISRSLFDDLEEVVPSVVLDLLASHGQRAIPAIAKNPGLMALIEQSVARVPTEHAIHVGDSRSLDFVPEPVQRHHVEQLVLGHANAVDQGLVDAFHNALLAGRDVTAWVDAAARHPMAGPRLSVAMW